MDLRCPIKWGTWAIFLAAIASSAACSEAVMMNRETDHGGVVTYIYKVDRGGPLGSKYRREALDLIKAKCPAGSRIIREGAAKRYTSAGMGVIEGTEDEERGTRWGIQFECRNAAGVENNGGGKSAMGSSK